MIRYSFWWLGGRTVRAACILLAACVSAPSFAQQEIVGGETLAEARSLIADGESVAARDLLMPWAQAGSADAQFELGRLYASDSPLKDDLLARQWLRRAGLQDHIEALMLLGESYYDEDHDYTLRQSFRAYKQAADLGHPPAMYQAGSLMRHGDGTARDIEGGLELLRAGTEAGDVDAMFDLAVFAGKGDYGPVDVQQAVDLYRKAADAGYPKAINSLAQMYWRGSGVEQSYSEAYRLLQIASKKGSVTAKYNLAQMYRRGRGRPVDIVEARKWMHRAADAGDVDAQGIVGDMARIGEGGPVDQELAFRMYEAAAKQKNPDALVWAARLLLLGVGTEKANDKAFAYALEGYFRRGNGADVVLAAASMKMTAADFDSARKMISHRFATKLLLDVGQMFLDGKIVEENAAEGMKWIALGAEQGHPPAQLALAKAYTAGEGVPLDIAIAAKWWEAAMKAGNLASALWLAAYYDDFGIGPTDLPKAAEAYFYAMALGDDKAIKRLTEIAELGIADAEYWLGRAILRKGRTTENTQMALIWLERAAEKDHAEALTEIALIFRAGRSGEVNDEAAATYYARAVKAGSDIANLFLGILYEDGIGVPRDGARAMELYQVAADKGVATAQYRLGLGYNIGLGGKRDDAKAHFWLSKAMKADSEIDALLLLTQLEAGMLLADWDRAEALHAGK